MLEFKKDENGYFMSPTSEEIEEAMKDCDPLILSDVLHDHRTHVSFTELVDDIVNNSRPLTDEERKVIFG